MSHDQTDSHCAKQSSSKVVAIGVAAGAATAAAMLFGRKAIRIGSIGKGHPLKHRVLDVAAGTMQRKYPIDAMSTYLNGFHNLVTTYGKTFHTWQYDKHDFPYRIPQLMMGFTEDGQANNAMVADRDRRVGVSTSVRRQNRTDISMPNVVQGANF